jgi:hypothetical protein
MPTPGRISGSDNACLHPFLGRYALGPGVFVSAFLEAKVLWIYIRQSHPCIHQSESGQA